MINRHIGHALGTRSPHFSIAHPGIRGQLDPERRASKARAPEAGRQSIAPSHPLASAATWRSLGLLLTPPLPRRELLNRRWRDIDLEAALITVKGSAGFVAGERTEGTTKSGRSRALSVDKGTVDVLKAHRKRQLSDKLLAGETWKAIDEYVFMTGWGEPIHPDTVSSLMAILIKNYNEPKEKEKPAIPLPHAKLHDLRHIHATTLLLAGVPVHVVAARLGHADPSITLRVYAHVINEQLVEAADIFARQVDQSAA